MKASAVLSIIVSITILCPGLYGRAAAEGAAAPDAEPGVSREPAPVVESADGDDTAQVFVVSATRMRSPITEVGSSVTVITGEQLRSAGMNTLSDVFRSVPSLDVTRNGGPGGAASVMIRGAKSEHTLVMIDGVAVNDPSSVGRLALIGSLSTDSVERVEIVRGPQGPLYGSEAMGGVINVITKKGAGMPRGFVEIEYGTHDTLARRVETSGATPVSNYMIGLALRETGGVSAAATRYGNREKDAWESAALATRLGWTPTDSFEAEIIARYLNDNGGLDNEGGPGGDDPNHTQDTSQVFLRTQARLKLSEDRWNQTIGCSLTDIKRSYRNDPDPAHPDDASRGAYKGQTLKADWQHSVALAETNVFLAGIEAQKETMRSDYSSVSAFGPYSETFDEKDASTSSMFVQDTITLFGSWFTSLGVRLDDHDRFGSKTTWRMASTVSFGTTGTRLKASYGTGFKAPSLYQLYSNYGSKDLDPETSRGWDAGVEQDLWKGVVRLGASYFSNTFDDLIDFDSVNWKYLNISGAKTRGVEATLSARLSGGLDIDASYTFTDTEDDATGKELLRRPRSKASIAASSRLGESLGIRVQASYTGPRYDVYYDPATWAQQRVRLGGYATAGMRAWYDLDARMRVTLEVDNLFDRKYEEVYGYQTPGRCIGVGLRASM